MSTLHKSSHVRGEANVVSARGVTLQNVQARHHRAGRSRAGIDLRRTHGVAGVARILLFIVPVAAVAQSSARAPRLKIPPVATPPRLEDYRSQSGPGLVVDFRQHDPKDLEPATEETVAYLAYEDANSYVTFVLQASELQQFAAGREVGNFDDVGRP